MSTLLARFIACLAVALPFAVVIASIGDIERKSVTARTAGPTADVVAALEALKRSDVEIKVSPAAPGGTVSAAVAGGVGFAILLWVASSVVVSIERFLVKWRK